MGGDLGGENDRSPPPRCRRHAPAPIQVSFLGMLGTMGASFIDYLITDPIVTPPEFASAFTGSSQGQGLTASLP